MGDKLRIVIIGGVAGGASAAARARRLSEDAAITIIEKGPYVSFANCGLPYHIGGVIPDRAHLLIQTPRSLKDRFNITVRTGTEAVAIDRAAHTVTLADAAGGGNETIPYDRLILSPGADAFRPPMPGVDLPSVFTLQTIPDMDAVLSFIAREGVRSATIIGGGFIGLEAAENLALRGIAVSIVEADSQVMPPLDPEMAELLHQHLAVKGIALHLGRKAAGITHNGKLAVISFEDGGTLESGMVILSIGVRPRTKLARDAGLAIGATGGIAVDEGMRTSDPEIYAIGDAIEVVNPVTGLPGYVPLAGPANRQGRIAADRIFGRDSKYRGTLGTSICKVFDLAAGGTGASEKLLRKAGRDFRKIYIHAGNHASYYPGAFPVALKLMFDPATGTILGAQAVGTEGVDKRIDVLATAMSAGLTVYDLEHLELSYAPPFGSAKDPVNMAGFTAANLLRGDHRAIQPEDLHDLDPARDVLLDVRTVDEFKADNIDGSINIPVNELRARMGELPRGGRIIAYCAVGLRGYVAQRMLSLSGFDAVNLSGGFKTWLMANGQLSGAAGKPVPETFRPSE
ncbi:MAG: CoA-disulfide reductase [Spirochaetes bacterium]|nr:MAG: CoA-disulfide reductase [Spirochaetota bacterium]